VLIVLALATDIDKRIQCGTVGEWVAGIATAGALVAVADEIRSRRRAEDRGRVEHARLLRITVQDASGRVGMHYDYNIAVVNRSHDVFTTSP
jgi:hypothetical protein